MINKSYICLGNEAKRKTKTMKTLSQQDLNGLNELFTNFNVKTIFDELDYLVKRDGDVMPIASCLLDMIIENSNDFTKDVAEKGSLEDYLTHKQKWSLAYQIKNNLEVYILAVAEYSLFEDEQEMIEINERVNDILENEEINTVKTYEEGILLVDEHFEDFRNKSTGKIDCQYKKYQTNEGELYEYHPPKGITAECIYVLISNKK